MRYPRPAPPPQEAPQSQSPPTRIPVFPAKTTGSTRRRTVGAWHVRRQAALSDVSANRSPSCSRMERTWRRKDIGWVTGEWCHEFAVWLYCRGGGRNRSMRTKRFWPPAGRARQAQTLRKTLWPNAEPMPRGAPPHTPHRPDDPNAVSNPAPHPGARRGPRPPCAKKQPEKRQPLLHFPQKNG